MTIPLHPAPSHGDGWMDRLMLGPRTAYEYLVFYMALVGFGAMSMLWSLAAAVLHLVLPRRIGVPLGQFVIMAGFRLFVGFMKAGGMIKCDLGAIDTLRGDAPIIIAPNHPSMLDAVLVISRLPKVVCIMKAPIWDNPFLGGGARLASYIRNDTSFDMVNQATEEVRAGHQLLVFPEGTRTVQQPVNPFKRGFALIARMSGAPVQTIFIETDSPFLSKGWSVFRKPRFPVSYRARLGRRFRAGEDTAAFVAELEDYYSKEIVAADRR